ncbi:hypothetical protein U9M48_033401 [Paspalum notatum var. saurae]|uniref:Aquaporin TIP5-1 n=1 Tax=Paspalum notatum var. saurae TaxID=547442 RepID=A0AAQ3X6K5_PASNO
MASSSNLLVHLRQCFSPPSLRSYFAEFISTFLFVFTAEVPTTRIAVLMTGFGAAIMEGVLTFLLVYTVHVAVDPRQGHGGNGKRGFAATALGALAVGLTAGACVLSAGSLTGASMNPARSFGPALVSGDFKNQAVYWAGPMIGAAVAALAHQVMAGCPAAPESRHGNVEAVVV